MEYSNDLFFTSGCGRIQLVIKDEDIDACSHQGQCYQDVKETRRKAYIREQLDKVDPEHLRQYLKEFGAWEPEELQDHEDNLDRLLWTACCDIREMQKQPLSDEEIEWLETEK